MQRNIVRAGKGVHVCLGTRFQSTASSKLTITRVAMLLKCKCVNEHLFESVMYVVDYRVLSKIKPTGISILFVTSVDIGAIN